MTVTSRLLAVAALCFSPPTLAAAQPAPSFPSAPPAPPKLLNPPIRIPASGGEVILSTDRDKSEYDEVKYAAARRAGDFLFISGQVTGIPPGQPHTIETYKASVRRMFTRIQQLLRVSGADLKDVVMIHSFHVWRPAAAGPDSKNEQFDAFSAVKDEFMPAPHPAWTAIGVDTLLPDGGLTETEFIAYAPRRR